METVVPLSRRKIDIVILVFFWINLLFITYQVDIEQIILPDISGDWSYPIWPLPPVVDLIHWYGNNFDPVLIARPMWWKMTIWIDVLFFGPYYMFAIYAFTKGKNWIRFVSIIYSGVMMTNVTIILGEEFFGTHPTPNPIMVLALNLPWLLFPILILWRMHGSERPFTETVAVGGPNTERAVA
ncbi:MAG: emopamil-binding family protein [Polyangiales bacterium]